MKYEQPYGVSDPNAPYVNGNPTTGTMGSIPPAASIEHPMREIVNLINDTGGTPNEADLHQLAKGVQGGQLIYAEDFGIQNSYLINLSPPLDAYAAGQSWNIKIANGNTDASVININSLGPRQIVAKDGAPLKGGEMSSGSIVALVDDGVHLQLQGVGSIGAFATSSKNYYVNEATGDDSLHDGTSPTVIGGTAHGPFKTIMRAVNAVLAWNMNGWYAAIFVADGVYDAITLNPLNGSGGCTIVGNKANPGNVVIQNAAGEAVMVYSGGWGLQGVKVVTFGNGTLPHQGDGIRLFGGATFGINYIEFGACVHNHINVQATSTMVIDGPGNGGPIDSFITVSGNAQRHMMAFQTGFINMGGGKLNVTQAVTLNQWAMVMENSVIDGMYGQQTGAASVTAQKYSAYGNGVINTNGAGVNALPGNVAGALATGGQYL